MMLRVALFVILLGCPQDDCEPMETRCNGNVAEICGSDGAWRESIDCSAVTPGDWYCCWTEEIDIPAGYTCRTDCEAR